MYVAQVVKQKKTFWLNSLKINYTYTGGILFCFLIYLMSLINAQHGGFALFHPLGLFINNVFLPLALGLVIYGLLTEKTKLRSILSTNTFEQLGKSSYAFYLLHYSYAFFLLHFYGISKIFSFSGNLDMLNYPLYFIQVVIVALLLHKYVEEPACKFIQGVGNRLQQIQPQVVSTTNYIKTKS